LSLKARPNMCMCPSDNPSASAGAGLNIGVLSGVSAAKDLIPFAEVITDSVDDLHTYVEMLAGNELPGTQNGLNPDFAF